MITPNNYITIARLLQKQYPKFLIEGSVKGIRIINPFIDPDDFQQSQHLLIDVINLSGRMSKGLIMLETISIDEAIQWLNNSKVTLD